MTKVLAGARHNGKTSELIRMAAKEGLYIVAPHKDRVKQLQNQALNIGVKNMLYPLIPAEARALRGTPYGGMRDTRILVDDADALLSSLLRANVAAMTVTTPEQADTNLLLTCTNVAPEASHQPVFDCSNCGWDDLCYDHIDDDELNYCPNCGAKIIKEKPND